MLGSHHPNPAFTFLTTNDKPNLRSYIKMAANLSQNLGVDFHLLELPSSCEASDIAIEIERLNGDHNINGIIIGVSLHFVYNR